MTYGDSRRPDLAARLRRGQRVLKGRLQRPETVLAVLRAAHDSLDPEGIGKVVVARWVIGHGREFSSADLRKDSRVTGAAGAVLAWPLRCRAQTVAALVMVERRAAQQQPTLEWSVGEALSDMLEGPAQALDNALKLRRSEALSVTDDLTQLYNSRYLKIGRAHV